ncbi:MAG: hypothetical protein AB8H80_19670 [Planctomycetota bacterium]
MTVPSMTVPARSRDANAIAMLLALLGVALMLNGWLSGSLMRYRLAAYFVGAVLAAPLVTLIAFGPRARRFWRKLLFAAVPLALCLLAAEVAYRLLASPAETPAELLRDPRLGHRIQPGTAGTDARGFRNPDALPTADVLVVGDSQTWGFHIAPAETFAQRYQRDSGRSCYQMANGSDGPIQYVELVRQGLALRPRHVAIVFYYGNDLIDAADYTGLAGAEALRRDGATFPLRDALAWENKPAPNRTMATVDAVFRSSRLLDAAAASFKDKLRGGSIDMVAGAVRIEHATAATILLPHYRGSAIHPGSKHVREGLRVAALCWPRIAADCAAAGANLVVLTIPTKEYCYTRFAPVQSQLGDVLRACAKDERATSSQLAAGLQAAGVTHIDLLDDLLEAMRAGRQPWFASGDGHLCAAGHAVVAEVLLRELRF